MHSQSVRIGPGDHRTLKELSDQTNKSMQELLSDAIEHLRRRFILQSANVAFKAMRKDPKASKEYDREVDMWDSASLADVDLEEWAK